MFAKMYVLEWECIGWEWPIKYQFELAKNTQFQNNWTRNEILLWANICKEEYKPIAKRSLPPIFFSFPLPAAFHPQNNRHWKSNGIFDTLRFTIFAYKLITIAILVERATHPYGEISFAFGPHRWEFYCCKFYGWTNYKLNRSSLSAAFFVCHSHISTVALNIESVHIKCNEIWEFAFFFLKSPKRGQKHFLNAHINRVSPNEPINENVWGTRQIQFSVQPVNLLHFSRTNSVSLRCSPMWWYLFGGEETE